MAITIDDDAVLLDSGIRMKFIRDAEYSHAPPLVGLAGDEQTLLQCTPDGKLKVDASVSIDSIDIGDVDTKAKDEFGASQYLQVEVDPVTSRYALIVNDPRLAFSGDLLKVEATLSAGAVGSNADKYDEITGIVFGGNNTIASYTVPAGKIFHLRHVSVSGTNIATYRVLWDEGNVLAKKRTYYAHFNEDFFFEANDGLGTTFAAGSIVYVDVIHTNSASTGNFNSTISGRLEDA